MSEIIAKALAEAQNGEGSWAETDAYDRGCWVKHVEMELHRYRKAGLTIVPVEDEFSKWLNEWTFPGGLYHDAPPPPKSKSTKP